MLFFDTRDNCGSITFEDCQIADIVSWWHRIWFPSKPHDVFAGSLISSRCQIKFAGKVLWLWVRIQRWRNVYLMYIQTWHNCTTRHVNDFPWSLQSYWNVFCIHAFSCRLGDDTFCMWPWIEPNMQSWFLMQFCLIYIQTWYIPTKMHKKWFFLCHFYHAQVYSIPCVNHGLHDVDCCMWPLPECNTYNLNAATSHENICFWSLGRDFSARVAARLSSIRSTPTTLIHFRIEKNTYPFVLQHDYRMCSY